jgi:hypothetical protein
LILSWRGHGAGGQAPYASKGRAEKVIQSDDTTLTT